MRDFVIPKKTTLEYLLPLLKGAWNHAENKPASGTVVRRWIDEGIVRVNGGKINREEALDFPIFSIVLFHKSPEKRITIF